jgi:hypothetical protein
VGCGVKLDPSEEQVHSPVDRILGNSRQDAQKKGGVGEPALRSFSKSSLFASQDCAARLAARVSDCGGAQYATFTTDEGRSGAGVQQQARCRTTL